MTDLKTANLNLLLVHITEIKQKNIMTYEYHTKKLQQLWELSRAVTKSATHALNYEHISQLNHECDL